MAPDPSACTTRPWPTPLEALGTIGGLGDVPQAFTHSAFVSAAFQLDEDLR